MGFNILIAWQKKKNEQIIITSVIKKKWYKIYVCTSNIINLEKIILI